jgi:hypothetical protein
MGRSVTGGKLERGTGVAKGQSPERRSETGKVPQREGVKKEQHHTGRWSKKREVTQVEGGVRKRKCHKEKVYSNKTLQKVVGMRKR